MASQSTASKASSRAAQSAHKRMNRDSNVMAAAIEVMSLKGYSATSIQEVADRVGVLKGSLYHYFNSKEDLLYRIIEESHEQVRDIAVRCAELGLHPIGELLEYVRQSSLWYLANIERANIFFTERRHLTGARLAEAQGWGRDFETHIRNLIVAAQADGSVRADLDQRLLTRFVLGAVNNVRYWPTRSKRDFDDKALVEALVVLIRSALVCETTP